MAVRPPAAGVLAAAVPLLFIHAAYQPSVDFAVGGTTVTVAASDGAIVAVALAAAFVARRDGIAPLRRHVPLYALVAALLAWIAIRTIHPAFDADQYAVAAHAVTAAKFAAYATLAFAVPLLVRTRRDLALVVVALVLTSVAATVVGALQFLGIVDELSGRRPGQREPSFVGIHDFAALSGAALCVAVLAIATRSRLPLAHAAGAAGSLGLALSGAVSGALGVAAAASVACLAARRTLSVSRAVAIAAIVVVTSAGVLTIRSVDAKPLLDLLGIERTHDVDEGLVDTSWRQRAALAYIGGRVFLDNPVVGAGWQATKEEPTYAPYVGDARERFPALPEFALPSPEHPWGVQNAYVQAAAELGIIGLFLFVAPFVVGLRNAVRARPDAAIGGLWLLVAAGVWIGLGLVAGIPLAALTWLGLGLAVAARELRPATPDAVADASRPSSAPH